MMQPDLATGVEGVFLLAAGAAGLAETVGALGAVVEELTACGTGFAPATAVLEAAACGVLAGAAGANSFLASKSFSTSVADAGLETAFASADALAVEEDATAVLLTVERAVVLLTIEVLQWGLNEIYPFAFMSAVTMLLWSLFIEKAFGKYE